MVHGAFYYRSFALLAVAILFSSCRKDKPIAPGEVTPYVINYPEIIQEYLPPVMIPSSNPMTEEGVELGRKLFFEELEML